LSTTPALRLLDRAGLPVIRHWVIVSETVKYELDFAYLGVRLGLAPLPL
jgi:hypothetical protein